MSEEELEFEEIPEEEISEELVEEPQEIMAHEEGVESEEEEFVLGTEEEEVEKGLREERFIEEEVEDEGGISLSTEELDGIIEGSETIQTSPFDQISKDFSNNYNVDEILIFKKEDQRFICAGASSQEGKEIFFEHHEPIIEKVRELKKDIFIPKDIYRFKPLLNKDEEFFKEIDGMYLKGKFENDELSELIILFMKKNNEKTKEELYHISNKIIALI